MHGTLRIVDALRSFDRSHTSPRVRYEVVTALLEAEPLSIRKLYTSPMLRSDLRIGWLGSTPRTLQKAIASAGAAHMPSLSAPRANLAASRALCSLSRLIAWRVVMELCQDLADKILKENMQNLIR